MPRKLKTAHARQLLIDIAQVEKDAADHNATAAPDAQIDPDPNRKFHVLTRNATIRVNSEVWRRRGRRPKI